MVCSVVFYALCVYVFKHFCKNYDVILHSLWLWKCQHGAFAEVGFLFFSIVIMTRLEYNNSKVQVFSHFMHFKSGSVEVFALWCTVHSAECLLPPCINKNPVCFFEGKGWQANRVLHECWHFFLVSSSSIFLGVIFWYIFWMEHLYSLFPTEPP